MCVFPISDTVNCLLHQSNLSYLDNARYHRSSIHTGNGGECRLLIILITIANKFAGVDPGFLEMGFIMHKGVAGFTLLILSHFS